MASLCAVIALGVIACAEKIDLRSELHSLVESEWAFAKTSEAKGMREAFLAFLADESIIFRPHPVNGKKWMEERPAFAGRLTWQPAFADVARAGDMGYTTGPWAFRSNDSTNAQVRYGNFVSVWKKQPDQTWKVVIDFGNVNPPPTSREVTLQSPILEGKTVAASWKEVDREKEKMALLAVDGELTSSAQQTGAVEALLAHASDDIRLLRADAHPFMGRESIRATWVEKNGSHIWRPIDGEVAKFGDLGYTYGSGEFTATATDSIEYSNYLRIWKKQPAGEWKIVLDIEMLCPPPPKN
jgi:ketosteroid isomerase-like protein